MDGDQHGLDDLEAMLTDAGFEDVALDGYVVPASITGRTPAE